jgi:hypothetical protein
VPAAIGPSAMETEADMAAVAAARGSRASHAGSSPTGF